MVATKGTITTLKHPAYSTKIDEWQKWRLTYDGGAAFINAYLKKYSDRESNIAFVRRKMMAYNPAFAKEAIDEIKNSIFLRFIDIVRKGGSPSYQKAISGEEGGVDLFGASMNTFIGTQVLPELLTMAKVGVYVDSPSVNQLTLAEAQGLRPYVYLYPVESIRNWCYLEGSNQSEFSNLLLEDYYLVYDTETGLPIGDKCRYKHLWRADGVVYVQYYTEDGEKTDELGTKSSDSIIELEIERIPFVVAELSSSLLTEVANYQIALLNLASSDIAFALQSNFPFYTEQYDSRADDHFLRSGGEAEGGQSEDASAGKQQEVKVGTGIGRRYPKGMERPGFIHPSPEPLQASMQKQEQMKAEIRQLVQLSVATLSPTKASAESKGMDRQGLESGLAYIGLTLEYVERQISEFWHMYEKRTSASIFYPETYAVKSEAERRTEAKELSELLRIVPSKTYMKSLAKRIATLVVGRSSSTDEMQKVYDEVDEAKANCLDLEVLAKDIELGLVDLKTASEACGYPKGTVEKAAEDHAERLARISKTQMKGNDMVDGAARGVSDQDPTPNDAGSREKQNSKDTTKDPVVTDKTRGEGK